MKCLVAIVVLGLACVSAAAQKPRQDKTCIHTATTQSELNDCARGQAKQADDAMNRVYKRLLATVAAQPRAKAKIVASQRAWLAYRDSYIDAMYPEEDKQVAYGSMYPMEADLLIAYLTAQQTKALEDILENYEDTH